MTVSVGTASTSAKATAMILLISFAHGTTHFAGQGFYNLIPYIQQDLGLTFTQAGIFGFIAQISGIAANLFGAPLVDMTGKRMMCMVVVLAICAAGFFAIGFATTYIFICVMLVITGTCISMWHPPAISYLSGEFANRRGFAIAMHGTGASLGDTLAPLAVGAVMLLVPWRETTAVLAAPMLVLSVFMALTMLGRDTTSGGKAKRGISFKDYAAGIKDMVRQPAVAGLCLVAGLRSVAQVGLTLFLPLYLVTELGFDPLKTGFAMTALFIGGIIAAPIMGVVSDRIGRRPVVMAGVGATTVVIIALTFVTDPIIFVSIVSILGFVLFAIRPVMHSWLMDITPPEMGGSATGLMFSTQYVFAMFMSLGGGILADLYGLIAVFYLLAGSMLLANIAVALMPKDIPGGKH
jgi:MFS family permease